MGITNRYLTATALAAALAVVPAAVPTGVAQPAAESLDRPELRAALAAVPEAGAPGVFAEVREGRREWDGAAGIADLSNARPARPGMHHRVGSITKTFVAAAVLQLVAEGRLGLDDPVGRLLPGALPPELAERVTVRMLLNHTSGIGNYTQALLASHSDILRVQTTTFTPQQLLEIGLSLPPTGPPGAAHSYSNTGYILAGMIIEAVTGRDARAQITDRIIRPLRLTDTYFPGTDPHLRRPHAGAYFGTLGVRDFSTFDMSWADLAGELVSTTEDLNDFYDALLGGRLLAPEQLAQMRTTVPMDPAAPEAGGYGLGLLWVATPCGPVWGHDGAVIGHLTISLQEPQQQRRATFAQNLTGYQLPGELHPIDAAWQDFLFTALCPQAVSVAGLPNLAGLLRDRQ